MTDWVLTCGSPKWLLSGNNKQFTAQFFQPVCKVSGAENRFSTTYHPQCSGRTEQVSRAILQALGYYVASHPRDWDLYTDILTYAYNTQVHRATKRTSLDLLLSRAPQSLALALQPVRVASESASHYLLRWKQWLQCLWDRMGHQLRKAQC